MATVDVTVGGKKYQLACENGQERHLAALAAMVDADARTLAKQVGAVGESRLLLMAALMIADRLNDAQAALAAAQAAGPGADRGADAAAEEALRRVVDRLDGLIAAHSPQ